MAAQTNYIFRLFFGDHIEDSRKAFTSKPDILNPIIYKLLNDKIKINWIGKIQLFSFT